MYTRFRNISYVMAYAVATIPLWYYVTDDRIMLLMTLVIGFAYLNVVISSVDAAQGILISEKTKISMPRWLPDKPKYQKWWAIKQRTMRWHILLIPAKMGLALGFVEFLNKTASHITPTILRPYYYVSWQLTLYPQWETLLIGVSILALFTLLECVLIAALTIMTVHPFRVVTIRLLIALSVIGVMSQYRIQYTRYPQWNEVCDSERCPSGNRGTDLYNHLLRERVLRNIRIGDTIETGFFTLDDTSVLLAANIMRPVFSHNIEGLLIYSRDNRPFVARQLVAALLGVLVYLVTIFSVLRFVRDSDLVAET